MALDHEGKWQAIIGCDAAYDGSFFYGVKTTGIFCRPSCKSKSPKREHILFFDTAEQACACGLRPCKRCRPDLLEFQPQKEMAEKIKKVYDHFFADRNRLREELAKLSLSHNRITQLFYKQYGKTPVEYLNALRIEMAKELLADTQDSILHIALLCGFNSLSTFYDMFKRLTDTSPGGYRQAFVRREVDL
ncbi:hypothetical protein P22_1759 [Propionispora sp. 2/2-37]|uniref:bifunctional transcriptional activator/DNA repair enzyme AdaA n=1 Tax=Propionispora sp. 2/2-37 TaxID=1677858 RepID=UPI0006BB6FFF|nr:Ada metal-binding domain-containing protein [Propionispora sp. 2/2-37]CUH95682.1 hypothetical protein P22_1759 [Propionispora sp. 2/2-37]